MRYVAILLTVLTLVFPSVAQACMCMGDDAYTPQASHKNIADADLIFTGRVSEMVAYPEDHEKAGQTKIVIQVDKILKGDYPASEIVIEKALNSCDWVSENTDLFVMDKSWVVLDEARKNMPSDTPEADLPKKDVWSLAEGCSVYMTDTHIKQLKSGSYRAPVESFSGRKHR